MRVVVGGRWCSGLAATATDEVLSDDADHGDP